MNTKRLTIERRALLIIAVQNEIATRAKLVKELNQTVDRCSIKGRCNTCEYAKKLSLKTSAALENLNFVLSGV